jgi:hypothetical protein
MKRSDAARRIQIFLEARGYCGNCDDGEALVNFLITELEMLPPRIELPHLGTSDNAWEPEQ